MLDELGRLFFLGFPCTHSEVFTDVATSVGSGQDGTVFVDATQLKTRTLEM